MPNHAPPSQGKPEPYGPPPSPTGGSGPGKGTGPFNTGPVDPGRPSGGQRALLAGVLGGLLTLGIVTGAAVLFTGGDDPEPEAQADPEEPATTPEPPSASDDRIGTSVAGSDLLTGDCINFEAVGNSTTTFDIVSCGTPHLAEITSQAEHPDAGGGFPGVDELHLWGDDRCRQATSDFLGTAVLETTFESRTLVPDFADWSNGLYRVSCLVSAADGARLIESVQGRGASYPRSTEVAVNRLRAGDCFVPTDGLTAFDLGSNDIAVLTPCNGPHDGLFFGRAVLDFGIGVAFPGQETVDAEAIELCDTEFTRYFGVTHEGFNYRFWTPDQALWNVDDRNVYCAVIDEKGLPATLDLASFQPLYSLSIGQCFVFGPEEGTDTLGLDDQVEPVGCDQQHHGQLFGYGELEPTGEPFPGADLLDEQIAEDCIALFTNYVGISPFDSAMGDFIYWFPNESGWEADDLRWACALLTDDLRVGTIEGANA
ncbi:MAG: septum formation family protein [Acidimicrobiia bacterium]|nr:septum formation family protein [Acidimicrobiia bacterium]